MKNNELMNKVSRSVHKVGFTLKKHSPEILIGVGVVGTVASVVMACKATLKVNDVIDEAKETIDKIHECANQEKHTSDGAVYTQEDANKDLAIVYAQTGWKFVKLYGPAAVVGIASIGCMVGSSLILRKRNAALAAAFAAAETSFKDYRSRVIDRFGEDMDRELRFNIKAKEIEETEVDENGNETVVKKTVQVADPTTPSIYSVFFDDGCKGWTKNAELNKVFLLQRQEEANFLLKNRGLLTLNDVYDMLGIQRTKYGQHAGWVYTEDGSAGDNFVDFGIFDIDKPKSRDFVNGIERTILLDFNCIGNAYDYI